MEYAKIPAIGILCSIGLAFLTATFDSSLTAASMDSLYALSGLGMGVFGIWGSILLIRAK